MASGPAAELRLRADQRRGHGDRDRQRQERRGAEGGGVVVQHVGGDEAVHEGHHGCGHQGRTEQADLGHLTPVGDRDHERRTGDADRRRDRHEREQQLRLHRGRLAERPEEGHQRDDGEYRGRGQPDGAAGGWIRSLHMRCIGIARAPLEVARALWNGLDRILPSTSVRGGAGAGRSRRADCALVAVAGQPGRSATYQPDATRGHAHRETTERSRRVVPLHGDAEHVRARQRIGDLPAAVAGLRPPRGGAPTLRFDGRPHRTVPPACARGAVRPRSPVLGRRPPLRPRLPRPSDGSPEAGHHAPARRSGRADHRSPDGPHAPAVGGVRHRRPARRPVGAAHEVPPRHDRRRGGRDHAADAHQPDARRGLAVRAGRVVGGSRTDRLGGAAADARPARGQPREGGTVAVAPRPQRRRGSRADQPQHVGQPVAFADRRGRRAQRSVRRAVRAAAQSGAPDHAGAADAVEPGRRPAPAAGDARRVTVGHQAASRTPRAAR